MGIVVDENETKSSNFIVRALVYHWTVKPIVKSAAQEEREKHLFLYWKGVPFNRWMLFASSFLIQFCCGSLYASTRRSTSSSVEPKPQTQLLTLSKLPSVRSFLSCVLIVNAEPLR